jgi:cytochrome c-type biogenesis protein CcmF
MIAEIGHFALILALLLAIAQGLCPLVGAARQQPLGQALARPIAFLVLALMTLSIAALTWSFYVKDFSVAYVAQNANSQLPTAYRLAAVWGGHEGSLLLWVWLLACWSGAVAFFSRSLDLTMRARVLGVLGLINAGLTAFILFASNPFLRLMPAPSDGRDLNPLLQDPGMVFHPPMLYLGYVGFAVTFAFAIAALLAGRLDAAWARWSRPWTLIAWAFLTLGIALGSYWAYYELGWGGWWFWDPVENASLMPWLVGTALLHALAVTEKRGAFRNWTVLLAIAAFSLSLLGTFLVRSGVLTSVHAFAADPKRGVFILVLLTLVIGASLTLFAWRAHRVPAGEGFALFSRESLLLTGNVLLVCAAATVLLGTLYPLALDAFDWGKISVGPPYFNSVFVPLMAPVLCLMAITPQIRWKNDGLQQFMIRLRLPIVMTLTVLLVVLLGIVGHWTALGALGIGLSIWGMVAVGIAVVQRWRTRRSSAAGSSLTWWGMQCAHLGVAVFVAGVSVVGTYQEEKDVRMAPGDRVQVGGYTFRFEGVSPLKGPNYQAERGHFVVFGSDPMSTWSMYPEKRHYFSSAMPMTETAIHTRWTRDLYISLGEALDRGDWTVRVYYKPFVLWIWVGCLFMAMGGLLAMADRRYRLPASSKVPCE